MARKKCCSIYYLEDHNKLKLVLNTSTTDDMYVVFSSEHINTLKIFIVLVGSAIHMRDSEEQALLLENVIEKSINCA